MGLTADIYDIFGFTNHVISEAAALQASITDVTTTVNHFAALLDNQSGATVVSMRNYITGFASSIQAIADAVNMAFTQILMVYQGAYALLDSDAYAVIDEDTISEVLNAYRNSYLWMDDELDIVKEMYYRVCGFTDVTMPSFEMHLPVSKNLKPERGSIDRRFLIRRRALMQMNWCYYRILQKAR